VLGGNGQFEPLHRARDGHGVVLAAEADQFDSTVVRHQFLEAEMRERSEMLQFGDRQLEMDPVRPGVVSSSAGMSRIPCASRRRRRHRRRSIAASVAMNAFLIRRGARE